MRERAEDLTGIGIGIVIWASAALAGAQSIHKLAKLPQNTASPDRSGGAKAAPWADDWHPPGLNGQTVAGGA